MVLGLFLVIGGVKVPMLLEYVSHDLQFCPLHLLSSVAANEVLLSLCVI